ncbi:cilia- and flagella-associated protein 44 [Teleopsis dalmanni]|uniref:cilia- and flagella-associated protein 44 n=1 Tax=Teleopsis dalmanni TaxID=139649 RepID=UPI0018CE5BC7|nr:cilia- and flagella-associated protein 44 [Teleopsis dalmanni]
MDRHQRHSQFTYEQFNLRYSFGYDCKRLRNLCHIDKNTLVFASGNYIHYFDINSKRVTFKETKYGGCIGFITRNEHPRFIKLLTVAENGSRPIIFIYEYPSHKIRITLIDAAKSCFTCGAYHPNGEIFASQAGYPDFMLTIWRWQKAEIVLRAKSFQSDILCVHFSLYNPIMIVTAGVSHIKFWKMANTFTGLKLKGDLGRFGKTDFSDIYAVYMLPDENVISGCEWGNMLLWEAGLIKFEICRKDGKPCHAKPITGISLRDGEVTTIGMDGYVRVWYWETVDIADPPDDHRFVEIEPIYEIYIGDCEIRGLQKIKPFNINDHTYYVQDGNGGIWWSDISTREVPRKSYKLYSCQGGKVVAGAASPVGHQFMTLGEDGKIFLYDYKRHYVMIEHKFDASGTDLLWFNRAISVTGMEIVASFGNGVVRHLYIDIGGRKLKLLHVFKPHVANITKISINVLGNILVSASADKTLFIFRMDRTPQHLLKMKPMGYITYTSIPRALNWHRNQPDIILVGTTAGEIYETKLVIDVTEEETYLSYDINSRVTHRYTKFVSVKSRIRRDIRREQIKRRKELKRQRKMEDIEKLLRNNPGLQIDLEIALADSEPDEEEEPLYIPPKPNPILWLRYINKDSVWVSMGGYDSGYSYEIGFHHHEPIRSRIVPDADDLEIHSYLDIENFLVFGFINGKIRVTRTVPNDFTQLRNYSSKTMHDLRTGIVSRLFLSHDGSYLFSTGYDGNIFMYSWHGPKVVQPKSALHLQPILPPLVEDIDDPEQPSMEQEKIYAEQKRQADAAQAHEEKITTEIAELQVRFNECIREMKDFPDQSHVETLSMLQDEKVIDEIRDDLNAQLEDVYEDMAYDVEYIELAKTKLYNYFIRELDYIPIKIPSINGLEAVFAFRMVGLHEEFQALKDDVKRRLLLETKIEIRRKAAVEEEEPFEPIPPEEEYFFGLDPDTLLPRFTKRMMRVLVQYRQRFIDDQYAVHDMEVWEKKEPDPTKNLEDDDIALEIAKKTIGDHKLKLGYDFEPQPHETVTYKYFEILELEEVYFNILTKFNRKIFKVREEKSKLFEYLNAQYLRISEIHSLIPPHIKLYLPDILPINREEESPEYNLVPLAKTDYDINIDSLLYMEYTVDDLLNDIDRRRERERRIKSNHTPLFVSEQQKFRSYNIPEVGEFDENTIQNQLRKLPELTSSIYFKPFFEDGVTSPWLRECQYRYLVNYAHEQREIIQSSLDKMEGFNVKIQQMAKDRYSQKFVSEFIHTYLTSMDQELIVLRDSETIENTLKENSEIALKSIAKMDKEIIRLTEIIEEHRKVADELIENITFLSNTFLNSIKNHPFFNFLRRIFKKKYRPPKPPKTTDESSSSTSSDDETTSEEENVDDKSLDSQDMTTIRLDEEHCPEGLERSTYDAAFVQRAERHELERTLQEEQKFINEHVRELKGCEREKHNATYKFNQQKRKLFEFRTLRQAELNRIKVAVVIKVKQIQHFYKDPIKELDDGILFEWMHLVRLRKRVKSLKSENREVNREYRMNIIHLRRMRADIKFMRKENKRLKIVIKDETYKKFGIFLEIDELDEEMLTKFVFDMETNSDALYRRINRQCSRLEKYLVPLEERLIELTKSSTSKRNILIMLSEERKYMQNLIKTQRADYEKYNRPPDLELVEEIEKLVSTIHHQEDEIKCIEREICKLRTKPKPLQVVPIPVGEEGFIEEISEAEEEICPEFTKTFAFDMRKIPDEFTLERVESVVLRTFAKYLRSHSSEENIRKCGRKVTRYLTQAAQTLQGEISDPIIECITENMQALMPKKYLIYLSNEALRKLFTDIVAIVEYEISEVNSEEVITSAIANAFDELPEDPTILNKTQYLLERLFVELIDVLTLEELEEHRHLLENLLAQSKIIQPRCIDPFKIINLMNKHAKKNLMDHITLAGIQRIVPLIRDELMELIYSKLDCKVVNDFIDIKRVKMKKPNEY